MQTNFKNPKLYDGGGSLDSRWYVYYSFKSPDDGKFRLFKVFISSKIHTKSGKRDAAHQIIKEYEQKLAEGWNPFQFTERKYTNLIVCLNEMMKVKLSTTRKRTSYTYRNIANTFIKFLVSAELGKLCVSDPHIPLYSGVV